MRYIVHTRLYVEAKSPEQAREIVRMELRNSDMWLRYPYEDGIYKFDCDYEEVLTIEELVRWNHESNE